MSSVNHQKNAILLAGPTAVGKTTTAIKLAQHYNTEIISADSRQIYREMNIGTAKPTLEERSEVRHHLVDSHSIHDGFSAGEFISEVRLIADRLFEEHDHLLITGGTGFYMQSLIDGMNDLPDVSDEIIEEFESSFETHGIAGLQQMLLELDPEHHDHLSQHNPQELQNPRRLIRLLGIIKSGGQPFTYYINQKADFDPGFHPICIVLERDREELYERINKRVDVMLKNGLVQEAQTLYKHYGNRSLETVGYQELFGHFQGMYDIVTAVELIKRNSRRYAKRQMTWFRNQGNWTSFHPDNLNDMINFIDSQSK